MLRVYTYGMVLQTLSMDAVYHFLPHLYCTFTHVNPTQWVVLGYCGEEIILLPRVNATYTYRSINGYFPSPCHGVLGMGP